MKNGPDSSGEAIATSMTQESKSAELPYRVLSYYHYVRIENPAALVQSQRDLCQELDLKGRVLIGREGINGTVSGSTEAAAGYMHAMRDAALTREMEFKVDGAPGHVFARLSIKERPEVVTLGLPPGEDIDPRKRTGRHLTPSEFQELMETEEVVLLDGRNRYESDLGRFRGAICPDVEHFRDFPAWIRKNLGALKDRKILTYCTGGIRCEKLTGFLLHEGFTDVCQLRGGILDYGSDPEVQGRDFEGLCYVFDERIGVEVNRTESRRIISRCRHCGKLSPRYRNCGWPQCNAQFFCCQGCEGEFGRFCSVACREKKENQAMAGHPGEKG